jgi:hypothetical protein
MFQAYTTTFNLYLITFSTHGGFRQYFVLVKRIYRVVIKFVQLCCIWVVISRILRYTAYSAICCVILTPDLLSIIIDVLDTARYNNSFNFTIYDLRLFLRPHLVRCTNTLFHNEMSAYVHVGLYVCTVRFYWQILTKIGVYRQILFEISNAKFHASPPVATVRNVRVDTTRRVDAFRNSSVKVPTNGCQGNSVNVKALTWFIINSNENNVHYNKKSNRQIDKGSPPPKKGTAVALWLRFCATNRKVDGSIPDGVIGFFRWHNPSDRTMVLGSTQPLTEMSTRIISWG